MSSGPIIEIVQLDNFGSITNSDTVGFFTDRKDSNILFIDIDYVNALENEIDQGIADSLIFFLGVTTLHEYVHYGDISKEININILKL